MQKLALGLIAVLVPFGAVNAQFIPATNHLDLNCGTMACFLKTNYDVVEEEWAEVISVATEIEGYWNSVLDFILIDANLNGQLFDVGRYTRRLGWPVVGRWKKGEWVHLA